MSKTNALAVRQSFGKILKRLASTGEPIIIEKSRQPVAVLISLEDYERRFLDYVSEEKKRDLLESFRANRLESEIPSTDLIRSLRYDSNR